MVPYGEETHACPGPSGAGKCPYALKAMITYATGYAPREDALTGPTVKATCRCGASVSFIIPREAYRQGYWTVDWIA